MNEPRYPTSPQYRRRQEGISPGKAVFWITLVLGGLYMGYEFYRSVQEDIAGTGRPGEEDLGERSVKAPDEASVDASKSNVVTPGAKPAEAAAKPAPVKPKEEPSAPVKPKEEAKEPVPPPKEEPKAAPPAESATEGSRTVKVELPVPPRQEKSESAPAKPAVPAEKEKAAPDKEKHPPKEAPKPKEGTEKGEPKEATGKSGKKGKEDKEETADAEKPAPSVDLTFYQQLPNRRFQLPPDKPLPKTVQQPAGAATETGATTPAAPEPPKPVTSEAKPAPAEPKPAAEAKTAPAKPAPAEPKPAAEAKAAPAKPAPAETKPAPAVKAEEPAPPGGDKGLASVTAAIQRTLAAREGSGIHPAPVETSGKSRTPEGNVIIKRRGDEESVIALPGGKPAPMVTTGSGFTVQMGSFPDPDRANALVRRLQGNGVPARVERVEGSMQSFRVRAGSFPSREEASKAAIRWRVDGTQPIVVQERPGG